MKSIDAFALEAATYCTTGSPFQYLLFFELDSVLDVLAIFSAYTVIEQFWRNSSQCLTLLFSLLVVELTIRSHQRFLCEWYSPMQLGDIFPELFNVCQIAEEDDIFVVIVKVRNQLGCSLVFCRSPLCRASLRDPVGTLRTIQQAAGAIVSRHTGYCANMSWRSFGQWRSTSTMNPTGPSFKISLSEMSFVKRQVLIGQQLHHRPRIKVIRIFV